METLCTRLLLQLDTCMAMICWNFVVIVLVPTLAALIAPRQPRFHPPSKYVKLGLHHQQASLALRSSSQWNSESVVAIAMTVGV